MNLIGISTSDLAETIIHNMDKILVFEITFIEKYFTGLGAV